MLLWLKILNLDWYKQLFAPTDLCQNSCKKDVKNTILLFYFQIDRIIKYYNSLKLSLNWRQMCNLKPNYDLLIS